jgi:LAO/AO transport system kinase
MSEAGAGDGKRLGARSEPEASVAGVLAGERRAIAKTITLLESRRADHVEQGQRVLEALAPHAGRAIRLGITGPPGVGKSSFIEALGMFLIERGHRLAVLTIDPSSPVTGGSILGDKTRMARLAREGNAFIRPSPSGGTLGGVAQRTREAMIVCEAAGFDIVIVETVGVGQSEAEVASMVDFFAVLLQPGSGDELQGIKKGVLELADGLLVNKADGELKAAAELTCSDFRAALCLLRPRSPHWQPEVGIASAYTGEGIAAFWETVLAQRAALGAAGELQERRRAQLRAWLWRLVGDALEAALRAKPEVAALLPDIERQVEQQATTPPRAARALLEAFLKG